MGVCVSFGRRKNRRVVYTSARAKTIGNLYLFFKNRSGFVRTRDIREKVKVSNLLLWQLAFQGYLNARPRFCSFTDPTGRKRFTQIYYFKANIPRFEKFLREARMSIERGKERKKQEQKEIDTVSVLQNPEQYTQQDEEEYYDNEEEAELS